jgi:hypothetical protein
MQRAKLDAFDALDALASLDSHDAVAQDAQLEQ